MKEVSVCMAEPGLSGPGAGFDCRHCGRAVARANGGEWCHVPRASLQHHPIGEARVVRWVACQPEDVEAYGKWLRWRRTPAAFRWLRPQPKRGAGDPAGDPTGTPMFGAPGAGGSQLSHS